MISFVLGLLAGGALGAAAAMLFSMRDRLEEAQDWIHAYSRQERELFRPSPPPPPPRAVTKLTNRKRTIEI
ncbi:MAG: hypothetical protein RLZZ09_1106 [Pseudomonadota bacterium]|jgi:hypothetical protein